MPKPKQQHPIEAAVAANAKAGLDQGHVDLDPYLPDGADRPAELLGVKGPDPEQWGDEAREARGAAGGKTDPAADLPRGDG